MENAVSVQQSHQHEEICCFFHTAYYYVANNDMPYSDHPQLIDLQTANGVSICRVLHSNVSCTDLINHISSDMKCVLVGKMVAAKLLFSVLIDESTALYHTSCLIVYIRANSDGRWTCHIFH